MEEKIKIAQSKGLYVEAMRLMIQDLKESVIDKELYFITINPSSDVKLDDFKEKVFSLKTRPFMKNMVLCFEQRGINEQTIGQGVHSHIIVDKVTKYSPKQIQDRIYSTFKKMCGTKHHIDVRKYPASYRQDKLDYMSGKKWDADKEDAVKLNCVWREKYNIDSLYINACT